MHIQLRHERPRTTGNIIGMLLAKEVPEKQHPRDLCRFHLLPPNIFREYCQIPLSIAEYRGLSKIRGFRIVGISLIIVELVESENPTLSFSTVILIVLRLLTSYQIYFSFIGFDVYFYDFKLISLPFLDTFIIYYFILLILFYFINIIPNYLNIKLKML